MLGIVHFQANEAAYPMTVSAHRDRGLTPFGRDLLAELESLRIVADLAHLNGPGVDDALRIIGIDPDGVIVHMDRLAGRCCGSTSVRGEPKGGEIDPVRIEGVDLHFRVVEGAAVEGVHLLPALAAVLGPVET